MGNHGSAITGHSKVIRVNQAQPYGWENCEDGKDLLQGRFRVVRGGLPVHDIIDNLPGGNGAGVFRFHKLAIWSDDLFGLLAIFAGREQGGPGIGVPLAKPETVHKVIIRTKRGQFFYGRAANKDG